MDHEIVLRPYRICDWLLNSSRVHFGLHLGKNVRVTMKFEVPKRHILKPTLSTDMIQRGLRCRGKIGAMVEKARAHGIEILL
jgi:hypothetical protein